MLVPARNEQREQTSYRRQGPIRFLAFFCHPLPRAKCRSTDGALMGDRLVSARRSRPGVRQLFKARGKKQQEADNLNTGAGMSAKRQPGFCFTDKTRPRAHCSVAQYPKALSCLAPWGSIADNIISGFSHTLLCQLEYSLLAQSCHHPLQQRACGINNSPLCESGFRLCSVTLTSLSPRRGSLFLWGAYSDGVHGCRLLQQLQTTSSAPNKRQPSVPPSWRPVYQRDSVACRSFHSSTKRMPPSEPLIQADEYTRGSSRRIPNTEGNPWGHLFLGWIASTASRLWENRTITSLHHRG
ncbi:hypothetical protein V8C42DRAFT_186124 [Trichoderma barbatum]